MIDIKYEVCQIDTLHVVRLKPGETGIIHRVSLYPNGDYVSGAVPEDSRGLPLFSFRVREAFERSDRKIIPSTILECKDESDLSLLCAHPIDNHRVLNKEEFTQIREVIQILADGNANYRASKYSTVRYF